MRRALWRERDVEQVESFGSAYRLAHGGDLGFARGLDAFEYIPPVLRERVIVSL